MPKVDAHAPGSFCWFDLVTTEPNAARRFYTQLFGWRAENSLMPGGGSGVYTTFYKDGAAVCGLYEHSTQMQATGAPSRWQSYIAVEDVDAMANRVEQLGGKIEAQPFEIPGVGRMAAVADPCGAAFHLYEKRTSGESTPELRNEPGAYSWSELYTADPSVAVEFYTGLLGWRVKQTTSADGFPYYEFSLADGPTIAGMMAIRPEWGKVSPNWVVYFEVSDLEGDLDKVRSLGGAVDMPPMEAPGIGRFAMVSDPAEAAFMIIQMQG